MDYSLGLLEFSVVWILELLTQLLLRLRLECDKWLIGWVTFIEVGTKI